MSMEVEIFEIHAKVIRKKMKDDELFYRYHRDELEDDAKHSIELRSLFNNKKLLKAVEDTLERGTKEEFLKLEKRSLKRISNYRMMMASGQKSKVGALTELKELINMELKKTERKWIFRYLEDGAMNAYRVKEVHYKRGGRDESTHVYLVLEYFGYGSDREMKTSSSSITFWKDDIEGSPTLAELFEKKRYAFETPELYAQYKEKLQSLFEIHKQMGKQFLGSNKCMTTNENWRGRTYYSFDGLLEVGGVRNKLIVDTKTDIALTVSADEKEIPTHPYVACYDITKYRACFVHVDNMEEYVYDRTIKDKLVLPSEVSTLLDILIEQEGDLMEDIVKGKTGGIIVLATGAAGLGKTLTAEVYSEVMQKPLYVVQSSQLGIDVSSLESNLERILERAARWNAILMIDEADTYIHERGEDVVQNCIVGVFLRLLEYYKGVLFMTSNRANVVDDAILSRCTAHIEYKHPPREDLIKIWKILSEQFGAEMTSDAIEEIVDEFPKMGGRDVKNMVKMMRLVSKKAGGHCDLKMMKRLLPFMNFRVKMEEAEQD
jgi:hypothetical protein